MLRQVLPLTTQHVRLEARLHTRTLKFVFSAAAATVTGPAEMHCGIPSSPNSTSDAYSMKGAEQFHVSL